MPLPLQGLEIREMAIHEIRKGPTGGGGDFAVRTTELCALTPDLCLFFQDKIIKAASSDDSFRAIFTANTQSPVPGICDALLRDGTAELASSSGDSAVHLATSQKGSNSAGLLAVATVKFGRHPALVFLKLEHDQGVRIESRDLPGGGRVVELEHIRNLIVSSKTKLHKQAFVQLTPDGYLIEIADKQRAFRSTTPIAQFFLVDFLGAETAVESREATKRFVTAVQAVVRQVSDPKRQTEIRLNMTSELTSQFATVRTLQFGQTYLTPEELALFDAAVESIAVPAQFEKDLKLVDHVVSEIRMIGANGMAISGPSNEWRSRVSIGDVLSGSDEFEVTVLDEFRIPDARGL